MRPRTRSLRVAAFALACCAGARAQEGVLWVQVSNPQGRPIAGVVLSAAGPSSTAAPTAAAGQATEVAGRARIKLAGDTRPGDRVKLILVKVPQDLVFISPWDDHVNVPCFENKTSCVAHVVLGMRGSREILESDQAVLALARRVNAADASQSVNAADAASPDEGHLTEAQRRAGLEAVSESLGLKPEEVDAAVRKLGAKTSDPYARGIISIYEGNYRMAVGFLAAAEEERKRRLEQYQDELADVQMALAHSLYGAGLYGKAIIKYEEVARLRPDNLVILVNLGRASYEAGDYSKAERYFRRAAEIGRRDESAEQQFALAVSLNGLGVIKHARRSHAEAAVLYKQALAIVEQRLGPEHPTVATMLNNLASLYSDQSRYDEAEALHKTALAVRQRLLGPEHRDVIQSLNNLAYHYESQGRYAEAEPLYKQALALHEKVFHADHPNVAVSLNNLAMLYLDLGRFAEAEPPAARALAIYERFWLLSTHPNLAVLLNNLAEIYRERGKYDEAERLYKRALAIDEERAQADGGEPQAEASLAVARRLNNLGRLYHVRRMYALAEQHYRRALALREKALAKEDPDHPEIAATLVNLGRLLTERGRLAAAEPLLKRALKIREMRLPQSHPDVARSLDNLARLYRARGRYADAEALLERALAVYGKQQGFEHPDYAEALESYAALLRRAGRGAEAAGVRRRARAIRARQR